MDAVGTIRRLVLTEGWTIRRVARELRVSRITVRRYLAGAEPGVRKVAVRARPVLARVHARLDALLAEAPRVASPASSRQLWEVDRSTPYETFGPPSPSRPAGVGGGAHATEALRGGEPNA